MHYIVFILILHSIYCTDPDLRFELNNLLNELEIKKCLYTTKLKELDDFLLPNTNLSEEMRKQTEDEKTNIIKLMESLIKQIEQIEKEIKRCN